MLLALLTTSEILIMDHVEWKMLLRQKHRRDPDPSLLMKCLSRDESTTPALRHADVSNEHLHLFPTQSFNHRPPTFRELPAKLA